MVIKIVMRLVAACLAFFVCCGGNQNGRDQIDNSSWGSDTRLSSGELQAHKSYTNARSIAAGKDGSVHLVWYQVLGEFDEIHYRRSMDSGSTWEEDGVVASTLNVIGPDSSSSGTNPAIAVSGSDVYLVWQGTPSRENKSEYGELYFMRSKDLGSAWEQVQRLTYAPGASAGASIEAYGEDVYIVWSDMRDNDPDAEVLLEQIYFKYSHDGGQIWSEDIRLTMAMSMKGQATVAVVGENIIVLWMDSRDGNWEIYHKRSANGGESWSPDMRVTNDPGTSEVPVAVIDSSGTVHLFWTAEQDDGSSPNYVDRYEEYYKHSSDFGESWSGDIRLTYALYFSSDPSVAVVGTNIYLVWADRRDTPGAGEFGGRSPREIYFKHSSDRGKNWSNDKRLTYSSGDRYQASIVADSSAIHVVWEDLRDGIAQIYYKRKLQQGSPGHFSTPSR